MADASVSNADKSAAPTSPLFCIATSAAFLAGLSLILYVGAWIYDHASDIALKISALIDSLSALIDALYFFLIGGNFWTGIYLCGGTAFFFLASFCILCSASEDKDGAKSRYQAWKIPAGVIAAISAIVYVAAIFAVDTTFGKITDLAAYQAAFYVAAKVPIYSPIVCIIVGIFAGMAGFFD